jgi:hypothetical protein
MHRFAPGEGVAQQEIAPSRLNKSRSWSGASDGYRDLGSPAGPLPIDFFKASPGMGACPYEATNSFGPSQPTTPTSCFVEVAKASIPDWLLSQGDQGSCPRLAAPSW